tara:strand:+ start:525 stop:986 length:462 start_codon:yes stop_codon:yes gene_type:complete
MGIFWSTDDIKIDNHLLIIDDTFNMEQKVVQIIKEFNIINGMYTQFDPAIERVKSGMPIVIKLLGGIIYYYTECMYAEDFLDIQDKLLENDKITPVSINIKITEWLDTWDSFIKNIEEIDTHVHLLEYKNLYVFKTMLSIAIKMYKNVKDTSI